MDVKLFSISLALPTLVLLRVIMRTTTADEEGGAPRRSAACPFVLSHSQGPNSVTRHDPIRKRKRHEHRDLGRIESSYRGMRWGPMRRDGDDGQVWRARLGEGCLSGQVRWRTGSEEALVAVARSIEGNLGPRPTPRQGSRTSDAPRSLIRRGRRACRNTRRATVSQACHMLEGRSQRGRDRGEASSPSTSSSKLEVDSVRSR